MATTATTTKRVGSLPLVVTAEGAVVTHDGSDSGASPTKRAFVFGFTVDTHPVDVLLRVHLHNGTLFLDLVASEDLATLITRVGAMDLSAVAIGHPAPTDDMIDDSALDDAAP